MLPLPIRKHHKELYPSRKSPSLIAKINDLEKGHVFGAGNGIVQKPTLIWGAQVKFCLNCRVFCLNGGRELRERLDRAGTRAFAKATVTGCRERRHERRRGPLLALAFTKTARLSRSVSDLPVRLLLA